MSRSSALWLDAYHGIAADFLAGNLDAAGAHWSLEPLFACKARVDEEMGALIALKLAEGEQG